jgi:hypothetical protein
MIEVKGRLTSAAGRLRLTERRVAFVAKAKATKEVWFPPTPAKAVKKTSSAAKRTTKRAAKKTSKRTTKKSPGRSSGKAAGASE